MCSRPHHRVLEHLHHPGRKPHAHWAVIPHSSLLQAPQDIRYFSSFSVHVFTSLTPAVLTDKGLMITASQVAVPWRSHMHEHKLGRSSMVEFCAFLGILFVRFNCYPNCLQGCCDSTEEWKSCWVGRTIRNRAAGHKFGINEANIHHQTNDHSRAPSKATAKCFRGEERKLPVAQAGL